MTTQDKMPQTFLTLPSFVFSLYMSQWSLHVFVLSLFSVYFQWCWQEKSLWQSRASFLADNFLYSHDLHEWFWGDIVRRSLMWVNIGGRGGRVDSYQSFWVEKGVESKVVFQQITTLQSSSLNYECHQSQSTLHALVCPVLRSRVSGLLTQLNLWTLKRI